MDLGEFTSRFHALTGFRPTAWQSRFYLDYLDRECLPAAADIPTGLGKTAVTALWLIAIRDGKRLPRRLVYVVDRRAVVDQATDFVERMRERLPEAERFPISTLRGRHADNREWLEDPGRPAIIVGTVDMIGSRLLFDGYGVSRRMRPYHAGLLGADTLLVLDEAHLVPPFERLIEDIEAGVATLAARDKADRSLVPGLRLLSLSATGRARRGEVFRLSDDDVASCELTRRRISAVKRVTLERGDARTLSAQLADAAWALSESGTRPVRCLIYCNSRDQAERTWSELAKKARQRPEAGVLEVQSELFIGARRGHERDQAARRLQELGFLAGSAPQPGSVRFLVATSAGEVGVDLDADHMVCDLVAWERMVQRLGRVNRRGDGEARVVVIDTGPSVPTSAGAGEKRRIEEAHRGVRALLHALPLSGEGLDGSPAALRQLKRGAGIDLHELMERATTPAPLRPALTRAVLDAWAMTSLKAHTGRPEVAPWLRGWVEEEAQTVVVWRRHLALPAEASTRTANRWMKDLTAYFEAAPAHVSEQLETESWRVADWLTTRAKRLLQAAGPGGEAGGVPDEATALRLQARAIVAIALTGAGDLAELYTLDGLANGDKRRLQRELAARTLIVRSALGGLSSTGTLDPKEDAPPAWLGDVVVDGESAPNDASGPLIPWRVLCLEGDEQAALAPSWRPRLEVVLSHDGDGEVASRLMVYKWKQAATTEDDRAIGRDQSLEAHREQAERRARQIARRLELPEPYVDLLALAARLHDEGKRAQRWQRAFNAPANGGPYAKTVGPVNARRLDGYRHELGSLLYAGRDPALQRLDPDQRDLLLHLVTAHHGNARPTIGIRGCDQAPPSALERQAREVALRFARLQRRWGPWGLAWWEALLRAADQQASKDNERGGG